MRDRQAGEHDPAKLRLRPRAAVATLEARMTGRVVGAWRLVRSLVIGLLADGHVLLDGPPGSAKTRVVTALADEIECTFSRIALGAGERFLHLFGTGPIGCDLQDPHGRVAEPVFANILLAEGLDGASPEVRLALFDAMTERQVVIGGIPVRLPDVFFVCATRTVMEAHPFVETLKPGERDRFLLHLRVSYTDEADERRMLDLLRAESLTETSRARAPLPLATLIAARAGVQAVRTGPRLMHWMTALVAATRTGGPAANGWARWIRSGAGPRGSIALERCARAHAWLSGRRRVSESDVSAVAQDVLRHRLELADDAKDAGITPDAVIAELLSSTRP